MMKICVVTSTRAEYGIMSNLINEMAHDSDFDFRLCVTGTHLSKKFGYTRQFIDLEDKYIDEIDILDKGDDIVDVYTSIINKFNSYFVNNRFDLVVLLGDRYEIFAIASVAYMNRVKLAHIHGGESTYGALDEQFRHCITKLSNIHFPSCEKYRNRIIQMGENPEMVFNVGSLSVENISHMKFKSLEELNKEHGFNLSKYAMVTFNPVTTKDDNGVSELVALLQVLAKYHYDLLVSYPNIDKGHEEIISILEKEKVDNFYLVKSLNYVDYLSFSKHCSLFIGNSSSGIIEIPSLGVPVINIGDRQKGRETSKSVVSCPADTESIDKAIQFVNSKEYLDKYLHSDNIYYQKDSSKKIIKEIKKYLLDGKFEKCFYSVL